MKLPAEPTTISISRLQCGGRTAATLHCSSTTIMTNTMTKATGNLSSSMEGMTIMAMV